MAPDSFDPYHEWLGIPPQEQPPNLYRLLGITLFEENAKVIEHAADRQMAHVRRFQATYPSEASEILNHLAKARVTLLTDRKLEYDKTLQQPENLASDEIRIEGKIWYVCFGSEVRGPCTADELQELVRQGQVAYDTLIRKGHGGRWVVAKNVQGLFDIPVIASPPPVSQQEKVPQQEDMTTPVNSRDLPQDRNAAAEFDLTGEFLDDLYAESPPGVTTIAEPDLGGEFLDDLYAESPPGVTTIAEPDLEGEFLDDLYAESLPGVTSLPPVRRKTLFRFEFWHWVAAIATTVWPIRKSYTNRPRS